MPRISNLKEATSFKRTRFAGRASSGAPVLVDHSPEVLAQSGYVSKKATSKMFGLKAGVHAGSRAGTHAHTHAPIGTPMTPAMCFSAWRWKHRWSQRVACEELAKQHQLQQQQLEELALQRARDQRYLEERIGMPEPRVVSPSMFCNCQRA